MSDDPETQWTCGIQVNYLYDCSYLRESLHIFINLRLCYVKKMIKRRNRDVALLKNRLDSHNDGWRTATDPNSIKLENVQG